MMERHDNGARAGRGLTRADLVADLRSLGLPAGATVLTHSSLRSLGWVDGGADTVIDALLEALGPGGTLLVPTLTGTEQDSPERPPVFDSRATPCWTGRIPETLRQRTDARRSDHPTHSVAGISPRVEEVIAGHAHCPTPCAATSPYGRLADWGGFVLLLGVTHESNTSLHMIEEVAETPYHMQPGLALARVAGDDGTWQEIPTALHLWRWDRDFPKIEPLLRSSGAQRDGLVGQAPARLIAAGAMRDLLTPLVRQDPLYLLSAAARAEYERSVS